MIDRNLEMLLTETASSVRYPSTPDLTPRVLAAVQARAPGTARRPVLRPALLAALVAGAVVVAALAFSPSREAIARLFGVEGSKIEFLPTPLPGRTATPLPGSGASQAAMVGTPVTVQAIPEVAGFEVALPAIQDQRLGSSVVFHGEQAVVMHHYERFDLWQTRLRQDAGFGKGLPEGAVAEEVEVGGEPGVWLTGAEHYVYYYTPSGYVFSDSQRIVDRSTLVWRTEAFFYRIETDVSLEDALRIAETLP